MESDTSEFTDCDEIHKSNGDKKLRGEHICSFEGCGKTFSRPSRLEQHFRSHTGDRPYICTYDNCGKSYTRSQHLKRHQLVTHSNKEQNSVTEKIQKPKINSNRKYSCKSCPKSFLKKQHLLTHSQEHTNSPAFKCSHTGCESAFFLPSKLKRHEQIHCKGRYQCTHADPCEATFDKYSELRRHLQNDHYYTCKLCGNKFKQMNRFRKHMETHSNECLVYRCLKEGCGRSYSSRKALISHIQNKHEPSVALNVCSVCNKKLSSKQKLTLHMKTHHIDYKPSRKLPEYRKPRKDRGKSRTDYRKLLARVGALNIKETEFSSSDEEEEKQSFFGNRRVLFGCRKTRSQIDSLNNSQFKTVTNFNESENNLNNNDISEDLLTKIKDQVRSDLNKVGDTISSSNRTSVLSCT